MGDRMSKKLIIVGYEVDDKEATELMRTLLAAGQIKALSLFPNDLMEGLLDAAEGLGGWLSRMAESTAPPKERKRGG